MGKRSTFPRVPQDAYRDAGGGGRAAVATPRGRAAAFSNPAQAKAG